MSNKRTIALTGAVRAGIFAALVCASTGLAGSAEAQDLSDKSVKFIMDYAWEFTPHKFTAPTGKVIIVDKSKREDSMVPLDDARNIIKVARLSAHAQICKAPEAQAANFKTLMREEEKKGWSEQQMLYINQLHLFTVMWLTGSVKLTVREGETVVDLNKDAETEPAQTCSPEDRDRVIKSIAAYVCEKNPDNVIGCTS